MADFIKSILIFVLIATVMKGIINNDSFRIYFKFFSGLIMILFMASPLINFLSGDNNWYALLEKAVFNFELESVNDELDIADGKFEEILRESCKKDIENQIRNMAKERNIDIKNLEVILDNNSDSIKLASVDIGLKNSKSKSVREDSIEEINIKTIDVMSDGTEQTGNNKKKQATGQDVKNLKEDISSYFLIKEAAVKIWE